MAEATTFTLACIVIGVLLIAMTMGGSFVARLPLSAAMLYLAAGWGIGPDGLDLVQRVVEQNLPPLEKAVSLMLAGTEK